MLLSSFKVFRKNTTNLVTVTIATILVLILTFMVSSPPNYMVVTSSKHSGTCPRTSNLTAEITGRTEIQLSKQNQYHISCQKLLTGDVREVNRSLNFNYCSRNDSMLPNYYIKMVQDCQTFKKRFGYDQHKSSAKENDFPIAFSIRTSENFEQTEHLLRMIYRPQNVYCVQVEESAPPDILKLFLEVAKCLSNIVVPPHPVRINFQDYSSLEAELFCFRKLLERDVKWKYLINLNWKDFPLRTNREMVDILTKYNGANDIKGESVFKNGLWVDYAKRAENWQTKTKKSPPPHGFNIHRGSMHIIASRAFIEYTLNDPHANDLKEWVKDVRSPSEYFFSTLNHNPQLNIPGSYKGDPGLKEFLAREKIGPKDGQKSGCSGTWIADTCNIGPAELQTVAQARHFLFSEISLEVSPLAFQCLEQWYWSRLDNERSASYTFDVQFYKDMKIVNNHV